MQTTAMPMPLNFGSVLGFVYQQITPGGRVQAGNHPKQRRLSAPRRADEHNKFAMRNLQVHAVDNVGLVKRFFDGA